MGQASGLLVIGLGGPRSATAARRGAKLRERGVNLLLPFGYAIRRFLFHKSLGDLERVFQ